MIACTSTSIYCNILSVPAWTQWTVLWALKEDDCLNQYIHLLLSIVRPSLDPVGVTQALLAASGQEAVHLSIVIYCSSQSGPSGRYSSPSCCFRPRSSTSIYCYLLFVPVWTQWALLQPFLPLQAKKQYIYLLLSIVRPSLDPVGVTLALLASSGQETRWLAVPLLLSGVFYKWIQCGQRSGYSYCFDVCLYSTSTSISLVPAPFWVQRAVLWIYSCCYTTGIR